MGDNLPIDVAAGLIFKAGKLLLTQRRQGDHLENLWEFPGGKREPHESFEECLAREIFEELGVQVKVGQLVDEVAHTYPQKSVRIKFYYCTLLSGNPEPLSCQALNWVSRETLDKFPFPEADVRIVEKLLSSPCLWNETRSNS